MWLNTRKITASNPNAGPGDLEDPESYQTQTYTAAHIITQVFVWPTEAKHVSFMNQKQQN